MAEVGAEYTWGMAGRCLQALMEPIRWKRAVHLSNRWRMKRWVRICRRFAALDYHMPTYYRLKVMHRCLFNIFRYCP